MKSLRYLLVSIIVALLSEPSTAHEPDASERIAQLNEEAIGSVNFANSCTEAVQPIFNKGVALLHSFWFAAAIETFDEVLKTDPDCAMAEWGKAMSHWGNPLGTNRAKALLLPGAEAVARAEHISSGSPRERAYIEAAAALYRDFENTPDPIRAQAYERAMERLVHRYPDDSEAAIFFAMALNATTDLSDKSYAQPIRAAKILEREFEAQPNHPGIAHYMIHSYDVPSLAKHALPAAQKYAGIAPAAPHALHMPSHTFTRLGHWQESIETNLRSADAALAAGSPAEALHAIDYMVYAYLQTAQDTAAAGEVARALEVFAQVSPGDRYIVAGAYAAAAVPARFALERGDWVAATKLSAVESPAPFVDAIVYFARGLGAVRSNDLDKTRVAIGDLRAVEEKLRQNAFWAGRVAIQRTVLEAWLLLEEGKADEALTRMREAIALEDNTEKSAISPGPLAPAHEQMGELLLQLRRPSEALSAFKKTIEKEPGRFRSLYGGATAADAIGQETLAREYFTQIVNICANADAQRPELAHARAYLEQG